MASESMAARASRAASRTRRRPDAVLRSRSRFGLLLLTPFLFVTLGVVVVPSFATGYLSLTDWTGVGPANWVGLDNYARMLRDPEFYAAFAHNLIWTAILLTVPVILALLGAFLLSRIRHGQLVFRLVFFLPYTVASIVTSTIWQDLLDPGHGIGPALAGLGVPWPGDAALLGDGGTALPTIAMVNVWALWGFLLVIFLAAMQSIDPTLYEAARIDGANALGEFWHVTIPGILPTLAFVLLISIMWSLLAFDLVWITTQGGPAGATELVSTLLYRQAFERFDVGYAAALGLSLTFVSGVVAFGFVVLRRKGWTV